VLRETSALMPARWCRRVSELASVAPDAIADAVSAPDIVTLDRGLPVKLLDLVADGAARCRELLKPATSTT